MTHATESRAGVRDVAAVPAPATSFQNNYFDAKGKLWRGRIWETNFVPDVKAMRLWEWKERGGGGTNVFFMMAGGAIDSHVSRFQSGTYKKGHWHGSTAHLYVTHGVMRREGEDFLKCDWHEGSMYVSGAGPGNWLHQPLAGQRPDGPQYRRRECQRGRHAGRIRGRGPRGP